MPWAIVVRVNKDAIISSDVREIGLVSGSGHVLSRNERPATRRHDYLADTACCLWT